MTALIAAIAAPEHFKDILQRAKKETAIGGISKSRALIQRMGDHVASEVAEDDVPRLIALLLDIGDELIGPEPAHMIFYRSDEKLMSDLVCDSLRRLKAEQRNDVLSRSIDGGSALVVQGCVLHALNQATTSGEATWIGADDLERLKNLWCGRVQELSEQGTFLTRPRLPGTLASWGQWGDDAAPRRWCEAVASTDAGLLELLKQLLQQNVVFGGNGPARQRSRLNPRSLEPYLDTRLCFDRLLQLRDRGAIPPEFQAAAHQFILEYELLAQGKNPDAP